MNVHVYICAVMGRKQIRFERGCMRWPRHSPSQPATTCYGWLLETFWWRFPPGTTSKTVHSSSDLQPWSLHLIFTLPCSCRVTYKQNYEKFKMANVVCICALSVISLLLPNLMWVHIKHLVSNPMVYSSDTPQVARRLVTLCISVVLLYCHSQRADSN